MYTRNYWRDRSVEQPTRYEITSNGDGTSEITPEPGIVYEAGTPLTQARLNKQEVAISDAYTAVLYVLAYIRRFFAWVQTALSGKATVTDYSVSVPTSGWGASAPFTQTVNVTGLLATDTPLVDVALSTTAATAKQQLEAYGYLGKVVTSDGSILLTCYEVKPLVDLTLTLKVVR